MRKKMPVMLITVFVMLFLFSATASAALSGGSTIGTAPTVTMGATSITYGGAVTYFKFIAPQNYTYDIYSSDITYDSYGYLYDSAGNQLALNDDSGGGYNFKIIYPLSGGATYYIGVRNYSGSATNTCNLNIDYGNAPPVVTDANISISGSSGIYKINDTVTATWNNTAAGDNNTDISSVYVNFSQFGGGTAVAASNSSGTWTASYTLTSGSIDATNRNVSVTAYDTGGLSTTAADTSNASVDNQLPVISDGYISINSGTGTGGTFIGGDTVQASWNNTASGNNNADISSVTVNFSAFGGGMTVSATNNSGIWQASYTIGASPIDVDNVNISFTAIDDAGNSNTVSDTSNASVDNQIPVVTDGNIDLTGASGMDGSFVVGDTVAATWDNTSSGDNNSDIVGVTVDFSAFGGGAAVLASNSSDTWTAVYTIVSGSIDSTGLNVLVTVTDDAGQSQTDADTSDASVDNQSPVVTDSSISISGAMGTGGVYIAFDTITATWDNTSSGDNNSDIVGVTVDFSEFGGGAAVLASNSSDTWTALYTIVSGSIDSTGLNVLVTVTDDAGYEITAADTSDASVDNQSPVVTDSNISISGATGNGSVFIIGDMAEAQWNNTSLGDNNPDIAGVTFDFSEFGGDSAVTASESSGIWTASYTIVEDSIEAANLNVSVTATDDAGQYATEEDSSDAKVDSIFPTVSLSCSDSDYIVKGGDIVEITATFSEPMSAFPSITIDGTDVAMEEMTDLGSGIIWTYDWDVPFIDTSVLVSVSGSDAAGNLYIYSDFISIEIDSTNPEVTGVSDGEVYIDNRTIFFNEGTAVLNNSTIGSGTVIKNPDDYRLVVTDRAGNVTTIEFSIALEKATALVGGYYYKLIDIEHETKDKETKVMLNINSEVLEFIMDSVHENKDIKITLLENRSDKFTRKFSLGMTLADLLLIRNKGGLISLNVEIGTFELDPKIINIDRLLESFMGVAAKDIWVELKVTPAHYYRNYAIERASENDGKTVISESVSFDLYCSYGIKTVTTVNLYGEMDIMIPVNKEYISADLKAVRLMEEMTLETIDIEIIDKDGIYYAKFRSSTNGTFAIVSEK